MERRLFAFVFIAALAACGGGGGSSGGGGPLPGTGVTPAPTATPTPAPPTQTESSNINGTQNTVTFPAISSGVSASVTLPAASGSGSASVTLVLSSTLPSVVPTPQARRIHHVTAPQVLGAAVTPLAYISMTPSAAVTIATSPAFTFNFPAGTLSGFAYVAVFDEKNAAQGWNAMLGPITASGTSLTFTAQTIAPPFTLAANDTYIFAIVETGTPLPTPTPTSKPTATPTPAATATPTPGATASPVIGAASPLPSSTSIHGWSPYQVAQTLQYPVQSGWDGSGQTVAIVMDANFNPSEVQNYLTTFNVPSTGRTISSTPSPDGTPDPTATGDVLEISLDVETIAGLAPGANIIEYGMPSLGDQSFIDTVNQIVSDGKASVISYSAGGCEPGGAWQTTTAAAVFANAASKGVTIVASAGDQGNECWSGPKSYVPGVNWPASDANIIAAGGNNSANDVTFTYTDTTQLLNPVVWNDATWCGTPCAGGGGVSAYTALPSYQNSLAGAQSSTLRNMPDITLPAEGMAAYYSGSWNSMYGTSWSAPEYAALISEIYEYCKSSITNPVTIPYTVYQRYPQAFVDITSGNDQFGGSTPYYTASTGYDNASGLGIPLGMSVANSLCPNRVPQVRRTAALALESLAPAADRTVDVSPRVRNLSDMGRRNGAESTRVQLVLRQTGTMASDERSVIDALQQNGFTIVRTFSNHLVIDAAGPSAAVERFFRARMENVSEGRYGVRYMPVTQAVIPAAIAPYVSGITLDNVVTMHAPTR